MGGEITLQSALERVESVGVKERAEGLADLRHVLRNNRKFDTLSDASFHRIYEALFSVALSDQSTYVKAKTTTARSTAENRLSLCANTLRTAVEFGVRHIRMKTVRSVIDHIIHTSTLSNGTFCEPIALDYAKCLTCLLGYQPHVEHLTKDDRERVAAFCIECINIAQSELTDNDATPGAEIASTAGFISGLSYRSSRSNYKDSGDSQGSRSLVKQIASEMVTCLSLLTAASNAAPGTTASDLLSTLISFLQNSVIGGSSHQDAFSAINHILAWLRTEDIELVRRKTSALVRLIRNYWSVKSSKDTALNAFRNELLICWTYLRPYIFSAMYQRTELALRSELSGVLDVMRTEYSNRNSRDLLHLDDLRLDFQDATSHSDHIGTSIFSLQCGSAWSEANWATVYMIATLCNALSEQPTDDISSENEDENDDRPRKRPRLNNELDDTLTSSTSGSDSIRISALQTLAFLAQQRSLGAKHMNKIIDKLCSSCADENAAISSWAMLALASVASQARSTESSLSARWTSVWQITTRAISNASTCRAACHLLRLLLAIRLIPNQMASDFMRTMTSSVDLSGPTMLADSVAHLLILVVKTSQHTSPTSSTTIAESVLSWTFRHFWPSRFLEKEYASQNVAFEPRDVVELVCCCLGQSVHTGQVAPYPIWGPAGQAWLECHRQQDLIEYLLLLPESAAMVHRDIRPDRQSFKPSSQPRVGSEALILNNLTSEISKAHEEFTQLVRERSRMIALDLLTFNMLCKTCVITTCIAFCNLFQDSRRQAQLQKLVKDLLRTLADFIASPNCAQDKIEVMLNTFSSACHGLCSAGPARDDVTCERHICETVVKGTSGRRSYRELNDMDEDDGMDIDNNDASQGSGLGNQISGKYDLLTENTARFSSLALEANVTTYASVLVTHSCSANSTGNATMPPSTQIIDYLLTLPEVPLLLSSGVISSLSYHGVELNTDDCYRLLDHCADKILGSYTYERSEVALGAVLDIMSSLAPALTNNDNQLLYDLGIDMYNWYTSVALRGGVLSPSVQKRVAALLLQLCHVNTDYGRDDKNDVPSVRTSLFKLVELGTITVKFYLANRVATIFGLFVLSNHSAMFEDLQTSLPADSDWAEGMAIRLLFLAKLASAWHSLLRQCVYYIFETAGRIKSTTGHASRSVRDLAESLEFESPKKLFELFASQLLHTWLESQPVGSLPFEIFQYESLRTLIEQNESEVVAQLLVRGIDDGMEMVGEILNTTSKDLVIRSFAKCQAYCIGWDIPPSSAEPSEAKCESRLRKLLGTKEEHRALVQAHFASIMGHLYLAIQQEDVHDKWLDKRTQFASSAKALGEMKAFSHSEWILPIGQQPCFKSKYLCDEIDRLCRRTGHNPVDPWNPSSLATAVRMLFDSIEDALGPLNTCLVIRKLRLLVSMAGKVAVSSFPLEMLIHTLRPFLADSQCADDAMGVLQYLLHHGQQYLQANIQFLFGTTILMILQMRKHSGSKLESTTQESQHRATVQKMRNFHAWLVKFLQSFQRSDRSSDSHFYARITKALQNINLPGNARKGSPESSLLLLLLEDSSRKRLINVADRKEALVLLSDSFELSATLAEECIESDTECVRFADSLWSTLQIASLSDTFKEWAALILGRAYAATGMRPQAINSTERGRLNRDSKQYEGVERSLATIARRLSDLLLSRSRLEASLADYTLRNILSSFNDKEEAVAFEQMLPASVVPSMSEGSHGYYPFHVWRYSSGTALVQSFEQLLEPSSDTSLEEWAQGVSLALCRRTSDTTMFPALTVAFQNSRVITLELLPCIVHILLSKELEAPQTLRGELSHCLAAHFSNTSDALHRKQQYLIELLLYLREQPIPGERTQAERLGWLEVDWLAASQAGIRCGMATASLLFAESASYALPAHSNRRSSSRTSLSQVSVTQIPQELLLSIFRSVEEPDSFYGVDQPASLGSVLGRLDYEADGYRSLMFRSAQTDTYLRKSHQLAQTDSSGIIRSLSMLNLNSLSFALLSGGLGSLASTEELFNTARRLEQWDIMLPEETPSLAANSFSALQDFSRAEDRPVMQVKLRSILLKHVNPVTNHESLRRPSHEWFSVLASLVEMNETTSSTGLDAIRSTWARMQKRQSWMSVGRWEDFQAILWNRQTMFSVLAQNSTFSKTMSIGPKDCRSMEIESLLSVSRLARGHGQLQEALAAVNQCSDLIRDSKDGGLKADVAAKAETASVLWDLGEVTASVNMLQAAQAVSDIEKQDIAIGRSGLLAQLAHHLADARLERPDDILSKYLKPAITQLHNRHEGVEAGKVFYEFATFCDKQLQNPSNVEDFNRIVKLREKKLKELEELERLSKSSRKSGSEHQDYVKDIQKARQWYHIDDADFKRLKKNRDTFMDQSLQNYLRALHASDEYDICILRFFALWLENSDVTTANTIVSEYLPGVPTWKFVVLMNQLMSRLELDNSVFQLTLRNLAARICSDHPHHSLHHLFATTRQPSSGDQATLSRHNVALEIQKQLQHDGKSQELLNNVFKVNNYYLELAAQTLEGVRQNSKIAIKDLPLASKLARAIPTFRVPPATMTLPLRPNCNYEDVPCIVRISNTVQIMTGNSKPKKLVAYASNGEICGQLLKGGEDLRQDAIMEQVFGEVSKMLQNHKTTRQRSLHVRTYKVIPLSTQEGIIEFVPNSASFQSFLVPAHARYHPQDINNDVAREMIVQAKGHSVETRIKEFRKVCAQLQPVMRHFFFERFKDPDEWFEKRTAYTRTTATISILGYILGLGDRHCQNIMLDEKTGEVVHIDLGIAFEAGRVLPVPELVPFRLTRDVVDGMGITKTEGVFRRCCEFTLDALREDRDSIMTLLNVLRYDPLYSWTVSPLRAKRMQEESGRRNASRVEVAEGSSRMRAQEAGEADRALSIVEQKLSKTLSTAAKVNELIQQATDTRNLATLFHGWCAWL